MIVRWEVEGGDGRASLSICMDSPHEREEG